MEKVAVNLRKVQLRLVWQIEEVQPFPPMGGRVVLSSAKLYFEIFIFHCKKLLSYQHSVITMAKNKHI
jgi:hypothetical protein